MRIEETQGTYLLYKEKDFPIGKALLCEGCLQEFWVDAAWRRRGYGSYLLREILRRGGGFDPHRPSLFTAPAPKDEAGAALLGKFGFAPGPGGVWLRRRAPDLSAVELCHRFLAGAVRPGARCLDATCGNGHDTLFLCRLAGPDGRVLALDIQPAAVNATNRLLAQNGLQDTGRAVLCDHRDLGTLAAPGTLDAAVFNFGWLPGAPHEVHSTAEGSVPALAAALDALKPGGLLAAVLYSGKVIGEGEKRAALDFFRSLPLGQYTVLVCEFANWAPTAPLPCFVFKKTGGAC